MLWIAVAAAVALLVLGGVAVAALVATRGETTETTDTTVAGGTTTSTPATAPSTTSTTARESTSTTVTTEAGALPGQEGGRWVEASVPDPPGSAGGVALSDEMIVMSTDAGLFAYLFGGDVVVPIPLDLSGHALPDAEGRLAVWWEGDYSEDPTGQADEAIFAMRLPDGEKVRVSGEPGGVNYPQLAAGLVTWTEPHPSSENPEELWDQPIFGVGVDPDGRPQQEPQLLVDTATAYVLGDASWQYSLSDRYLAWETQSDVGDVRPGTYVLDLERGDVIDLPDGSWRPSVAGAVVAYFSETGLQATDLTDSSGWTIDPEGDWPSMAPTFVAYDRPEEGGGGMSWQIVVRGLGDAGVEQVLGSQSSPPYLSPAVAVASTRVAWVTDTGGVRLFEWESR